MTVELTDAIAHFVTDTPTAAIPHAAVDAAAACVVNSVACMLAGANTELLEPLQKYLQEESQPGAHPVAGTNLRTGAAQAALVNGSFAQALDFDDVLWMMPGHPSAVVLPALFAMVDEKMSGERLLDAYIIGIEVGAKIGLGIGDGHYQRGFHATGTLSVFAAIAALGRLHRLGTTTLKAAFGIGASMASGVRCHSGTMARSFNAGWAAHNAVVAVKLARCGMTACLNALEAKSGFFHAYGTAQSDMARCVNALGNPFVFISPRLVLKKYSCCYALHRPIDALLELREQLSLTPDNTDFIECRVAPGEFRTLINTRPTSGSEGKFSLDYILAIGAVDGYYGLAAFSDEAVDRPEIAALYPRIRKIEDPRCLGADTADTKSLGNSGGTLGFVEVTASRRDGVKRTLRVDQPRGSPERPLSWNDLELKFIDCSLYAGYTQREALKLFQAWRDLHSAPAAKRLVDMLAKP